MWEIPRLSSPAAHCLRLFPSHPANFHYIPLISANFFINSDGLGFFITFLRLRRYTLKRMKLEEIRERNPLLIPVARQE